MEFRTTLDPFRGRYVVKEVTGYFGKQVDGVLVKANSQSTLRGAPLGWRTNTAEELSSSDGKYRAVIERTGRKEGLKLNPDF